MEKIKSIVQEVDPIYVKDDCLQMMMAYKDLTKKDIEQAKSLILR